MLEKGPFEPMGKASLKHMTVQTVFLVAITPPEDAGGLSREYVLRIPSVS